jgi:hypothetical protein
MSLATTTRNPEYHHIGPSWASIKASLEPISAIMAKGN